jgi:carboxypeptidase family protein/calcineurin-like phosphoesterase family protein
MNVRRLLRIFSSRATVLPRRLRFSSALLVFGLICCCSGSVRSQSDFTVIALPDTQYYAKSYPNIFNAQMNWIVQNAQALNIQLVLGLGDVVDNPNISTQLPNADAAYKILDNANIPYFAAIGNHDYYNGGITAFGLKRDATGFNQYFGPSRYANKPYYGGNFNGSNENFWGTIKLGGQTYLVLLLEFYPRDVVLPWAANVLSQNAALPAIVVTHSQLTNNAHITTCDNYDKESYALINSNDGEQLWTRLLSQYTNVELVLSGHVIDGNGVARVADLGIHGNLVNQIMSDYQAFVNGGNGYLRIMKFHPSLNTIEVSTYSPYDGSSLTDARNQFVVPIVATPTGTTTTIKGVVRDSDLCLPIAGATVTDDQGHSVLTDQSGSFTLTGDTPGPVSLTASQNGRISASNKITANAGYTYTTKFSLSFAPATAVPSQPGSISGTINDAATGSAVVAATVGYGSGSTTSDTNGDYLLSNVPAGTVTLTVNASGYQSSSQAVTVSSGSNTTASFSLSSASTGNVLGRVTSASNGAAISGAAVSGGGASTVTDTTGSYALSNLPPGTYSITAGKSGWGSQTQAASVVAGANTSLNFQLSTSGEIKGTITNTAGVAIAGASVNLTGGAIATNRTVSSSSAGTYNSGWIPIGTYTVTVSASGYTSQQTTVSITTGQVAAVNFTITQ